MRRFFLDKEAAAVRASPDHTRPAYKSMATRTCSMANIIRDIRTPRLLLAYIKRVDL